MSVWFNEAVFYHIYPLGFCGAPPQNDFHSQPVPRLKKVEHWLDHIQSLGVNALYLGPVFEAGTHGYDTADYFTVDRRLGDNPTLAALSHSLHRRGMRLVLDAVFNHVGRSFWAFRDVQQQLGASMFCDWFSGLRFDRRSSYDDPFTYDDWNGHAELVKLNLHHSWTRKHLFEAVAYWVREFDIDGLRLDAADCLDLDFLSELAEVARDLKPDFYLMGEVIHGDYRQWANPQRLHSVTNYECYKGLYSSLVDRNYFEIAYALNRQFAAGGLYPHLPLYNFVDNHDVDRVASRLQNPAHLYPLYCLLFSMPGTPSLYYGSEWGLAGQRTATSDTALRPNLDLAQAAAQAPHPDLPAAITRLVRLRQSLPALQYGDYRQLHVAAEQLAFVRTWQGQTVIVALNASAQPATLELTLGDGHGGEWHDRLNYGEAFTVASGKLKLDIPPFWGRVLE